MRRHIVLFVVTAGCSVATDSSEEELASTSVTITLGAAGATIPDDYAGLSFETGALRENNHVKGYFFDPANTTIVDAFKRIGIKSLRIGGGTVDMETVVVPPIVNGQMDFTGIDNLFAFAKAVGVKVIYSVRLLNGSASDDAKVVQHIWQSYAPWVDAFAIGNEPDWSSYHYPPAGKGPDSQIVYYEASAPHHGYLEKWRAFATAIAVGAPGIRFTGPDTGSNWPIQHGAPYASTPDTRWGGKTWTANFAHDATSWTFPSSSSLSYVSLHDYPGEDISGLTTQEAISEMLSPGLLDTSYPALDDASGAPALPSGIGFRFTEANPFSGALDGASNSFATALWALDYLHWWAARGCRGVDFHNRQWGANDTIDYDGANYRITPIGYAMKAWDLGGHGNVVGVKIPSNDLHVSAYAVKNGSDLFVTIVNKQHGTGARNANVSFATGLSTAKATVVVLSDGKAGDGSLLGATLGGAAIGSDGTWNGTWSPVACSGGTCSLTVKATSAAVVRVTP